ncbi:MAG: 4Fe-4S dicluster domain-containing protein [Gammaproteobacteria bacterium]
MSTSTRFTVTVDPRRCEGEAACIKVCPARVFRMVKPAPGIPVLTRIKVAFHGGRQGAVRNEAECIGCLKCVEACPERAITVKQVIT